MVKLQQEISGYWRTLADAPAFLTVRSYVSTARKHGVDPLHALRQLFQQGSPLASSPAGPEQLRSAFEAAIEFIESWDREDQVLGADEAPAGRRPCSPRLRPGRHESSRASACSCSS
jgi:hypothetical protein